MHHANYHYGHAHLLARHRDLPQPLHPSRLQGHLEPEPAAAAAPHRNQYRMRSIRKTYDRAICRDYRGFRWRARNRAFPLNQRAELGKHRRVISNRLCGAVWCDALAGREAAVNGDPMVLDNADVTFGGEPLLRRQCHEPARPDQLFAHLGRPASASEESTARKRDK